MWDQKSSGQPASKLNLPPVGSASLAEIRSARSELDFLLKFKKPQKELPKYPKNPSKFLKLRLNYHPFYWSGTGAEIIAEALSKWSGESPKFIRDVFKKAKEQKAVLFFDELHKLTRGENGEESSTNVDMENQFLQEMNIRDKSFWIIGATSRPFSSRRRRRRFCSHFRDNCHKTFVALVNSMQMIRDNCFFRRAE